MDQALQDPDQGKGFFVSSTPARLSWGERKSPVACDDASRPELHVRSGHDYHLERYGSSEKGGSSGYGLLGPDVGVG